MSPTPVVSCFLITVLAGAVLGDVVKDIGKVKVRMGETADLIDLFQLRARRNLVDADPLLYYPSKKTGKAYMASDHKETWDSAKERCRSKHGGRLAHIESVAESKYLAGSVSKCYGTSDGVPLRLLAKREAPGVGIINDLRNFNREFTAENSDNAAYRSPCRLIRCAIRAFGCNFLC
ncbi:unnamed protein product [Heligmosomoides polygyrus]|uniref:C-type lectin domain-containing protein n=1 Tax=Heligmosomoides polygyrus TaxID=6339 RepID=A0A3P8B5N9_HELPZ|nr:unnamed protein product [Heligmosomoides polygyrus]